MPVFGNARRQFAEKYYACKAAFSYTEQRIVPTGLAARDNEVKQRRDLSESIFREWLPADAVRDGAIHDWAMTKAQRGGAPPVYVTRFGEP